MLFFSFLFSLPGLVFQCCLRAWHCAVYCLFVLCAAVSVAHYCGWIHRLLWRTAERELSKMWNGVPVTVGSLAVDWIRGKVWLSNIIVHAPATHLYHWESPVLARIGSAQVETNLAWCVLCKFVLLGEDVPLELYTMQGSDIQVFVERRRSIFNFYLLDPHIDITELERTTTTTTKDDAAAVGAQSTTTTTTPQRPTTTQQQQEESAHLVPTGQQLQKVSEESNSQDHSPTSASSRQQEEGGVGVGVARAGAGASGSGGSSCWGGEQETTGGGGGTTTGTTASNDNNNNNKSDTNADILAVSSEEKAQQLVDDVVRAVQSLGRAAAASRSRSGSGGGGGGVTASRSSGPSGSGGGGGGGGAGGLLQGVLVEHRRAWTSKLEALKQKKKTVAMQEGVHLVQQVGKAFVAKTQTVSQAVVPARRALDTDREIVYGRVGRVIIQDLRIFTPSHYGGGGGGGEQQQQQHQQDEYNHHHHHSRGDYYDEEEDANNEYSYPNTTTAGTTTGTTTANNSATVSVTSTISSNSSSHNQNNNTNVTATAATAAGTSAAATSAPQGAAGAPAASSSSSSPSSFYWNKPIVLKQVVIRAAELCPPLSAKDKDGFPAVYQNMDKTMDLIIKRVLAEMTKSSSGRLLYTAIGEVLEFWREKDYHSYNNHHPSAATAAAAAVKQDQQQQNTSSTTTAAGQQH